MLNKLLANWKTTAAGILAVATMIVSVYMTNGYTSKDFVIASGIISGLGLLLAKDS